MERQGPGSPEVTNKALGFIDVFNRNAERSHLQDRVKGVVGSMDHPPFGKEELDLIWSEGAIYNIGFQRGLNQCHETRLYYKYKEFYGYVFYIGKKLNNS